MAGYEGKEYTSDTVTGETIASQDDSATLTSFGGNLTYIPILQAGGVRILAEAADNSQIVITDDGQGHLSGTNGAGTPVTATGTLNYDTGDFTLVFSAAPAAGSKIKADYKQWNEYAPSVTTSIIPEIETVTIETVTRKLVGNYSFNAYYDLKMNHDIDLEENMLKAAAEQLKGEVDRELISTAYKQAGQSITWTNTYNNLSQALSRKDYYEDFVDCILKGCSLIQKATKRVSGNWLVTGKAGHDCLLYLGAPRFEPSTETAVGAHFIGTLNGTIKVYYDPFMPDNDFLIGYKGEDFIDAGLIYAPYLMFFATDPNMLDDFISRRGFITSYGKKMVNANMYVRGKILQAAASTVLPTTNDDNSNPANPPVAPTNTDGQPWF